MLGVSTDVTVAYPALGRSAPTAAPTQDAPKPVVAEDAEASPKLTVDPLAGLIVQFLNSSGKVETQSPSFAAVAYLKAGLTTEGFSRTEEEATQLTA